MKKRILSLIGFSVISCNLYASETPHGWHVGLGAGDAFSSTSHTNYLDTGFGWPKDRYIFNQVDDAALITLQSGYTWARNADWLPAYSVDINYAYVFPAGVGGKIQQYSLPEFENYTFQYNLQRQLWLATFKADIYRYRNLMPFVIAGAGVSINKISQYVESPDPDITPRTSPGFNRKTLTEATYIVGTGIDLILDKQFLVTLQYNYTRVGNIDTGRGTFEYRQDQLTNDLNANMILLSLNYYFDTCG